MVGFHNKQQKTIDITVGFHKTNPHNLKRPPWVVGITPLGGDHKLT